MDRETFDVMWNLSAPGGAAEGCFLRIPQTEMYHQQHRQPHELEEWMPNVSRLPLRHSPTPSLSLIVISLAIPVPPFAAYIILHHDR